MDNLFCAILRDLEHLDAVCSEANSKSVFGLSHRTLNFGIWMLLSLSALGRFVDADIDMGALG